MWFSLSLLSPPALDLSVASPLSRSEDSGSDEDDADFKNNNNNNNVVEEAASKFLRLVRTLSRSASANSPVEEEKQIERRKGYFEFARVGWVELSIESRITLKMTRFSGKLSTKWQKRVYYYDSPVKIKVAYELSRFVTIWH